MGQSPTNEPQEPDMADERTRHTAYTPLGSGKDEAKAERQAEILKQTPLIASVIKRFDKRLKELDSLSNIPDEIVKDDKAHAIEVAARKKAASTIRKEKKYLQDKINTLGSS